MNYGNLKYNKIKIVNFEMFCLCFGNWVWGKYSFEFVICIINCYFGCDYRILCRFLYIWRYLKDILKIFLNISWKMSQKCKQCSYELFFETLGRFLWFGGGPKWPPHHPHPRRQCQSSLPGEKNMKKETGFY